MKGWAALLEIYWQRLANLKQSSDARYSELDLFHSITCLILSIINTRKLHYYELIYLLIKHYTYFCRDFQDEVMARAQREMTAAAGDSGMGGGSSSGSRGALAGPADLGESIDNLRAEVASARVLVQQVKQKPALLR